MPETPVDKYRQLGPRECDVGLARQLQAGSKAHAARKQQAAQRQLRLSVRGADARHASAALFRGHHIGHQRPPIVLAMHINPGYPALREKLRQEQGVRICCLAYFVVREASI